MFAEVQADTLTQDTYRALELLEEFRCRLAARPGQQKLAAAIEKLILVCNSRLFQALIASSAAMALFGIMAWMREKTQECPLCVDELRANRARKLSTPSARRTSTGVSPASARAAALCERHRRLRKRSVPAALERRRGSDGRSSRNSRSRQDSEASEDAGADDGWLDRRGRRPSDSEKWRDFERWRELSEVCTASRNRRHRRRASDTPEAGSPSSGLVPVAGDGSSPAARRLAADGGARAAPRPEQPPPAPRGDSPLWCQTSSATSTASGTGDDSVYELNAAIAAEYNRVFAGTFGAALGPTPPSVSPRPQQQRLRRREAGGRRLSRSERQARSISVPCRPASRYLQEHDSPAGCSLPGSDGDALVLANGPLMLAAIDDDPLCTCECTCEYDSVPEAGGVWPPAVLAASELHRLDRLSLSEPAAARRGVGPRLLPPDRSGRARPPDVVRDIQEYYELTLLDGPGSAVTETTPAGRRWGDGSGGEPIPVRHGRSPLLAGQCPTMARLPLLVLLACWAGLLTGSRGCQLEHVDQLKPCAQKVLNQYRPYLRARFDPLRLPDQSGGNRKLRYWLWNIRVLGASEIQIRQLKVLPIGKNKVFIIISVYWPHLRAEMNGKGKACKKVLFKRRCATARARPRISVRDASATLTTVWSVAAKKDRFFIVPSRTKVAIRLGKIHVNPKFKGFIGFLSRILGGLGKRIFSREGADGEPHALGAAAPGVAVAQVPVAQAGEVGGDDIRGKACKAGVRNVS
ncbi:hypothetical protein FJT64_022422 [Amphibalanus amphitrite]|uniref:L27-1 domain-containing protein n=1 Tax=Amphibalanus amphitrite TaxID=1232801 RepID=A0A6A4WVC8_AMPAM|nr:hypothetical protein FJT64_022422 [Amphibalanus amphitrite]